ncbi:YdcH family protein [Roseibium aggregatum]|uniref:DUF465 domain-containing protein n=1 Tax=Roseibium aggregatum TaxID=187304 RepID=A0A926NY75_9HYPH|nr:DUF465 domain-containing protein [Roseibium aggregatum]MBD1549582.1 DUF465 domain-containing protein [Roseibium aggregatum]
MDEKPQALHEAFPEHAEKIKYLQEQDPEFKRRADEFHELSRAVHRAQMHEEPVEEVAVDELRKRRDLVKDELYRLILL